jgi:hypothetical protein
MLTGLAFAALAALAPVAQAATFGFAFAEVRASYNAPAGVEVSSFADDEGDLVQSRGASPDILAAAADDGASPATQSVQIEGSAINLGSFWEAYALSELSFTFENTGNDAASFDFLLTGMRIAAAAMLDDPLAETAFAYAKIEVQRSDIGPVYFEEREADGVTSLGATVPEMLTDLTLPIMLGVGEEVTVDIFADAEVFLAATPIPLGGSGPFLVTAMALACGVAWRRRRAAQGADR